MKKIFLFYLFTCWALNGLQAQKPAIDSLQKVLANTKDWQARIDVQRAIGYEFHGINPDSSMRYGERILSVAEQHNYERGRGMAWQLIGESYLYKGQYDSALAYLQKSEVAYRACDDKKNLLIVLSNSSFALELLSRYGECGDKLAARIELAKTMQDSGELAEAYRAFATIFIRQNHPEGALEQLRLGLAIWLHLGKNPHYFYSALGEAYSMLRQRDSTFYYAEKALAAAEQTGTARFIALEHGNMGRYYFIWQDYLSARAQYLQALAHFEKTASPINLPVLYNNLAENENALGNYPLALEYANKALACVEKNHNYTALASVRYNSYRSYEGLGDYRAAFQQTLLWKAATDSLNRIDNARKLAEVESRYRTREQEATISQQQLQLERQQNRQQIFFLVALLLLAAAAGLAFFLRSKRQRAELALRLKAAETQRLQEQDQIKSAFFANISHEFRTPLTLLLGPLREMEQGVFKGNALKYFGIMRRNAERLLQLINQLLDLSRLESGKLQLQPHAGDLRAGFRVMAFAFESLAAQRQIHYAIALPDHPLPAWFDRDKLEIIVANLLSNAFKFTPEEGRVELNIRELAATEINPPGPKGNPFKPEETVWVEIQVKDSGLGIAAEQQGHIFDRFYQVENTGSDLQPGSGIGLALAKEIVTLHGGTIAVESPVGDSGQGTRFTVLLPLRRAALSEMQPSAENEPADFNPSMEEPAEATASPSSARHLPIVLIVEDNADVRAYVADQLQGQCQVLEAADGQTALDMARAELPDLILSDLMMPVMDGAALTRRLKSDEQTSHIPVILLTAKAGQPERLKGLETGAEAYLTKPFDAEELRLVVAKTIAQRQVLREKFSREIRLGLPTVAAPSTEDLFLQKVLACIEENLDDDLFGVEQLAASVNMSRSNLFRKLDALTGKSPTTVIRDLRLARAKSLLEQGVGNTTEVAYLVGFNTPAYFVKCFTDEYGIPPGELRKKAREAKAPVE